MDVMDVANFFVDTTNRSNIDEGEGMTNMKLNKLLFFAQAASFQRFGKPLFDAPLEAWDYGPVVSKAYHSFKKYQRNIIDSVTQPFHWQSVEPETLKLLCDVYRAYAWDYSAIGLMRMTHQPDTPWTNAYQKSQNKVITHKSIVDWVARSPLQLDEPLLSDTVIITAELTDKGNPILPVGWEDD